MWLYVTVHDSIGMTVIQGFQELKDVVTNIKIREGGIQNLKVGIVDMLKYEGGCLGLWITYDIQELNNVGSATHILQDFDFPFDFLLFDRFEDLDDTLGVVYHIDPLKHFTIFTASNFANDLVFLLITPIDGQRLVIPVISWSVYIDICIDTESEQNSSANNNREKQTFDRSLWAIT